MNLAVWYASLDPSELPGFPQRLLHRLEQTWPEAQVQLVDVVATWGKSLGRGLLQTGLAPLMGWFPRLLQLWDSPEGQDSHRFVLGQLQHVLDVQRAQDALEAESFDLVITCHPIAAWLAEEARRSSLMKDPTSTVPVLAFVPAFHWDALMPSLYGSKTVLPHPGLIEEWVNYGVSDTQLEVASFLSESPVSPDHGASLRELAGPQPVVLIEANDCSESQLSLWMQSLALVSTKVTWWLHYGEDDAKAVFLREQAQRWGLRAQMFGHRDDLDAFVAAADIVVACPSSSGWPSLLRCCTPVVVWEPSTEACLRDAEFFVSQEVAAVAEEPEALEAVALELFAATSEIRWDLLHEDLGLNDNGDSWISLVQRGLQEKEEWLVAEAKRLQMRSSAGVEEAEPSTGASSHSLMQEQPEAVNQNGPFETIGPEEGNGTPSPLQDDPALEDAWTEEYSRLLLDEKKKQARMEAIDERIHLWQHRHELAERSGNPSLQREAHQQLIEAKTEREDLRVFWQRLQQRKQQLLQRKEGWKRDASSSTASDPAALHDAGEAQSLRASSMEEQFDVLTAEDELSKLKQRMRIDKRRLDLSKLQDE
ncbi:MAG: hypothetical protein EP343_16095 [Deltaproteobacteria bacterium]|nr:MAG: hypothetical protein EP343_16095 [Deltaproteobacteria bacterium]